MANLLSPNHWSQAVREARDRPYVEGARSPRPWLKLLLLVLLAVALLIGAAVALGALATVGSEAGWLNLEMFDGAYTAQSLMDEVIFVATLGVVLFSLASALLVAAMIVYRRGPGAFLWPWPRGGFGLFLTGFAVMFLVALALWPVMEWMEPGGGPGPLLDPAQTLDARLTYAAGVTAGLLVAAAAEEIAFRGVLLRVTGSLTRSLIVILLVNGVLFSAIHLDPDPVAFAARAASGMVWAWAALRLGNLAFAIGAHLANNLFIALLQAPISEAAIPGQNIPLEALGLQAVSLIVVLLAVEVLARRRARLF
ncbi:CPBP family intramembrane glutamic endopeptidase [Brevundimonas aveniformis]|uniref:CPBP family intramembrane glutamic endopeptidase n=1 Tax=Brevundimonas aveniformis TaxID=370977 RepID=UPI0004216DDC|nr:type II CAAX endopeptidase family protein [Brevundimonas aveniformis]